MVVTKILDKLKSATNLPIRFFKSDEVEQCIIYKFNPVNDDGVVRQDRLEIQIIGFNLKEVELEDAKVRKALLHLGDRTDDVLKIELNGGGMLTEQNSDLNIIRKISFYIITNRSER